MGSIVGASEPDEPLDDRLAEGDTMEVGLSVLYKQKGIEAWIKSGVVVHVRHGEEPAQVFDRAYSVCTDAVGEAIEELGK